MFGIGTSELLLICVVALVIVGPRKLPEIANKIGKAVGTVKRMSAEFQRTLNTEVATLEEQERVKKERIEEKDKASTPTINTSTEKNVQYDDYIPKNEAPEQEYPPMPTNIPVHICEENAQITEKKDV